VCDTRVLENLETENLGRFWGQTGRFRARHLMHASMNYRDYLRRGLFAYWATVWTQLAKECQTAVLPIGIDICCNKMTKTLAQIVAR